MTDSDSDIPPEATAGDHLHTFARAGIASVPIVGDAAVEFFNAIVLPPLEKRRDEWRQSVGERLHSLENDGRVSINDLHKNSAFITATMHASQAAMRTHQKEKLDALLNAVVNSAKSEKTTGCETRLVRAITDATDLDRRLCGGRQLPPSRFCWYWFVVEMKLDPTSLELLQHLIDSLLDGRIVRAVTSHEFLDDGPDRRRRQFRVWDTH